MDREVKRHFEQILSLARKHLTNVQVVTHDLSENRCILEFKGQHGSRRISVSEILEPTVRKYSYYLLEGGRVLIGLDNSSDRQALRMRYGDKEFSQHIHEPIPHKHTEDKQELELTEEKSFGEFMRMVLHLASQTPDR